MPTRLPARHETPDIDAAALIAARAADRLLAAALEAGSERWARHLALLPDRLRDDPIPGLRAAARAGRAAVGPQDSITVARPPGGRPGRRGGRAAGSTHFARPCPGPPPSRSSTPSTGS